MSQDYRATKSFVDPQDASENEPTNRSGNRPFEDVLGAALSRRGMLLGSLATAASTGFLAPAAIAQPRDPSARRPGGLLGFRSLTIEEATQDPKVPSISDDYTFQPLIPWGTPIEPGATRPYNGEPDRRPTPEEAELQVGIGHDGIWFFPEIRNAFADTYAETALQFGSSRKGMLCVNHEFGRTPHVIGKEVPENLEDVRVMQAVHGVSVVAIEERSREWEVVASPNARRITVNTPVAFSGPAADSPLLQNPAGNVPLGTVNNCGSGATPWGTYLTCEENFNGYFGGADFQGDDRQARYGFSQEGFSYDWYKFDKRFDLTEPAYENEQNRFGWVVEIDPYDGTQTPVKRTAMGRLKHEAVAIAVSGNGRVAAYMGDDQRFDYCYKYVSDRPWREAVEAGDSPLDEGTLYVARFDEDGTGEWLPLTIDNPELAA